MAVNTKRYIERFLKIRDKRSAIRPFVFNAAQRKLYAAAAAQAKAGKPVRVIVLKARQMGFSTLTEGMIFKECATAANVTCGIVAHETSATNNLFSISKRFYDNLPPAIRPPLKASNAKELIFKYPSGESTVKCMTAGNKNIGRSETFNHLHISEYAFWPPDKAEILTGLLQAVPYAPGTTVVVESTAAGYDDFKRMYDQACENGNGFIPVFCAWHEHSEYRLNPEGIVLTLKERELQKLYSLDEGQIAWRRMCIEQNCRGSEELFCQEYPSNPQEAFLLSGRPVFANDRIIARMEMLKKTQGKTPVRRARASLRTRGGMPEGYSFERGEDIAFYSPPEPGVPYVIGADTKGEGRDYYAAVVLNNITGEQVAAARMQLMESRPFTHALYCLGRYYNDAVIGVEVNFNTAPVEELARLGYERQYVRRKYDDMSGGYQKRWGFKTDGESRPILIDTEAREVLEHIENFNDIPTLNEMLTFVFDKNGRPDAMRGKHDDLLFADMIARQVRAQQSRSVGGRGGSRTQIADFIAYR